MKIQSGIIVSQKGVYKKDNEYPNTFTLNLNVHSLNRPAALLF